MVNSLLLLIFTLTLSLSALAQKEVVVILSQEKTLSLKGGKSFSTGNYLNEFAIPLMAFMDAGFLPYFVTPSGKSPNLDVESIDPKYFNHDQKYLNRAKDLFASVGTTRTLHSLEELSKFDLSKVAAVFVPGGHAPMIDLSTNKDLGAFLIKAHDKKITTALICHGPIALISALKDSTSFLKELEQGKIKSVKEKPTHWIYQGYKMTIFSNEEEKVAEVKKLKGNVLFYPQEALSVAGGVYHSKSPWNSNVVVDRELVTGQNPQSVKEFTETVLKMMQK
jgi:putative intracellular protease/amidase